MLKIQKQYKNKTTKFILLALFVALAIAGGALYLFRDKPDDTRLTNNSTEQGKINLDPPNESDAQRVEDNKSRLAEKSQNQASSSPPTGTKRSIKPVITYADQYDAQVEVGGYAPVFEEGGACTATFSNGDRSFNKSVDAVRNVSTTNCPVISVGVSEFAPKGKWTVMLKYDSPASSGQSDAKNIEVK